MSTWWQCPYQPLPQPVRIEALPRERADSYGLGPHGALLVRPDGHIGARWRDPSPHGCTLRHTLTALTGSAPSRVPGNPPRKP
ncbi:hypothetical protein ACIQWN_14970 [Streptomyces vinaceus]|uniref:hypothetical protein n=1 Tax=Streptomyces vinaceus TaxID=1960 RepID=UPI00381F08A2